LIKNIKDIKPKEEKMSDNEKVLGPTGKFPDGKMNEHDEGEIQIGITCSGNKVIMAFGKPMAWLGFNKKDAVNIANALLKRAKEIKE
jgi:hypothetical protein